MSRHTPDLLAAGQRLAAAFTQLAIDAPSRFRRRQPVAKHYRVESRIIAAWRRCGWVVQSGPRRRILCSKRCIAVLARISQT
jgi:hypothetical protein